MANSAQFSYDELLEALHLKVDDTQVDVESKLLVRRSSFEILPSCKLY